MPRHKLSEKNLETMTAVCSVDGLVGLRRAGKSVQCSVAAAAAHRRWVDANPEKAQANRRIQSDHQLTQRDLGSLSAVCSVCGQVDTVPWGRGLACGNRARQLRTRQQGTVSKPCPDCRLLDRKRVWTRGDGTCPRCSDTSMSWEYMPAEKFDTGGRLNWALVQLDALDINLREEPYGSGYSITRDSIDEQTVPNYESAVRGWKTLGSTRPWSEVA